MLLNIENKSLNLNDVNDHNWYVNAQHHYVYTWICICNVTWQFHFVYRQMALQFYISILFVDKRLCNFTFPFCSSTNGFATLHFHFVHRQKAFATLHFHFVRRQKALQLYISILFIDKWLCNFTFPFCSSTKGFCNFTFPFCSSTNGFCNFTFPFCSSTNGFCNFTFPFCSSTNGFCNFTLSFADLACC